MKTLLFLIGLGLIIGIFTSRYDIQSKKYVVKYVRMVEPTPTPTPSSSEIVSEIAKVFGPDKYVIREALAIAFCESGWRIEAKNINTNGSTDYNVFQINSIHTKKRGEDFKSDWKKNIQVAYQLYKEQGWNPWVCAKKVL